MRELVATILKQMGEAYMTRKQNKGGKKQKKKEKSYVMIVSSNFEVILIIFIHFDNFFVTINY